MKSFSPGRSIKPIAGIEQLNFAQSVYLQERFIITLKIETQYQNHT